MLAVGPTFCRFLNNVSWNLADRCLSRAVNTSCAWAHALWTTSELESKTAVLLDMPCLLWATESHTFPLRASQTVHLYRFLLGSVVDPQGDNHSRACDERTGMLMSSFISILISSTKCDLIRCSRFCLLSLPLSCFTWIPKSEEIIGPTRSRVNTFNVYSVCTSWATWLKKKAISSLW